VSLRTLRIATRASRLALWQAEFVANQLEAPDLDVQLVHVTTTGDQVTGAPLSGLGGVGVFTREIQQAVLDDRADVAVHSLKDLPTVPVAGIQLAAVPVRAAPWDALVLPSGSTRLCVELRDLPPAARVGTGSLRRRAQILHVRPDLQFQDVRGNVDTRLRKLDEGAYDALVLAEAGLDRLGLADRITVRLTPPDIFPAVGQGALGLECRGDDRFTAERLRRISDVATFAAVTAERQVLNWLRAGCHAPVGVAVTINAETMSLEAVVLSGDGKQRLYARHSGQLAEPNALGEAVADDLLRQGAAPLIAGAAAN